MLKDLCCFLKALSGAMHQHSVRTLECLRVQCLKFSQGCGVSESCKMTSAGCAWRYSLTASRSDNKAWMNFCCDARKPEEVNRSSGQVAGHALSEPLFPNAEGS